MLTALKKAAKAAATKARRNPDKAGACALTLTTLAASHFLNCSPQANKHEPQKEEPSSAPPTPKI